MQDAGAMYSQMNNYSNPQFPEQEQLKCPRCDSLNTKFCYYNNYNLSQPRHYCKNCKRYWTKGGSLRNIPVGGGTRKNSKRSNPNKKSSTSPAAGSSSPSSSPSDPQPQTSGLMLVNAAPRASSDRARQIHDLSGEGYGSLLADDEGHFRNSADGLGSNGSNLTHYGPTEGWGRAQDSGGAEEYRPNYWNGTNSWPGVAM